MPNFIEKTLHFIINIKRIIVLIDISIFGILLILLILLNHK